MMGVNQGDSSQYECTMGLRGPEMMILASLPSLALWAHFWLRKSVSIMQTTGAEYEESCWGSIRVIPANVSALWASRGPVCPIPALRTHFLLKKAKIIISGPLVAHCALNIVSPSSLYARTTLSEPKNLPTWLESGKLAKIIIFGPLEAHCALILAGIILMDPQHDLT